MGVRSASKVLLCVPVVSGMFQGVLEAFQGVLRDSAGSQGHSRGSQRSLMEVSGDNKRTQGCVRLLRDG